MKGKWGWGIIIFSIWLKQYKSNTTERLLFKGKMFIKLKVVCIDLHAGSNEGHYGDLITLQMHQRCWSFLYMNNLLHCCSLNWTAFLSHKPLVNRMQDYTRLPSRKPQISLYLRKGSVMFLKSVGGNTSFCYVSVHSITRPNSVVLCSHYQTLSKEIWVQRN